MDLTAFISILITCDLCLIITQSAESGDDRNYPRILRSDEAHINRKQKSAKDKRVEISQDEEMIERGSSIGETSLARRNHTGTGIMEHDSEGKTSKSKRYKWSNEEHGTLLRLAYAHYDSGVQNKLGVVHWKPVARALYGHSDFQITEKLRYKFGNLQKKMREAVKAFDNGSIKWYKELNDDLLKIYFATEAGDESKHAERIYAVWIEEHPEYHRVIPAYLLERAETMLFSVMKFSLDKPRGRVRPRQPVDWKPEHDRLLRFLWKQPANNVTSRRQQLYDEAVKHCSGMRHLDEERIYTHAKWLNSKSDKDHEEARATDNYADFDEGYDSDTRHVQYHSFMDDHNFPSLNLGTLGHHVGMTSINSQTGPSRSQLEPDLNVNISHSRRQSPDTNLYLGHRHHDGDEN